jgi:hypothetical protein
VYLKVWVLSEAGTVCCMQHPPSSMSPTPCTDCTTSQVSQASGDRPLVRARSGGVQPPPHALSRTKCRCLSEPAWQSSPSRHRLISPDSVRRQLSRFSSHHSSSDEDWFEVVDQEGQGEDVFLPADTKPVDSCPGRLKIRSKKCCIVL